MKKTLILLIAFAAVSLTSLAVVAEDAVVGEVVDQACFLRNEAHGADHQECAARCLKNGNAAGLLTDDGKLYTLAASASGYETFAAKRVRVAPRKKWSRPTCVSSSRLPRSTPIAACSSST